MQNDQTDLQESGSDQEQAASAPPITSRFLFVDVSAQRAKQLRRGALPRLTVPAGPHKLERIAMDEVRGGLIQYTLPTVDDMARAHGRGGE